MRKRNLLNSKGKRGGFTLTELLIAISIAAMMMGALAAIYVTAFQAQYRGMRQQRVQFAVTLATKRLHADLARATCIQLPVQGGTGNTLRGRIGRTCFDAIAGVAHDTFPGANNTTIFQFCRDPASVPPGDFWYWFETNTPNAEAPNPVYPACASGERLVGGPGNPILLDGDPVAGNPIFRRNAVPQEDNRVDVVFRIVNTTTGQFIRVRDRFDVQVAAASPF